MKMKQSVKNNKPSRSESMLSANWTKKMAPDELNEKENNMEQRKPSLKYNLCKFL